MADFLFIDNDSVDAFKVDSLDLEYAGPLDSKNQAEGLRHAWVVMVDWHLGDIGGEPNQPSDGFDLASLVRSRVLKQREDQCVAFCLYSGMPDDFPGHYPKGLYRQHALARERGVDWVFERPIDDAGFLNLARQLRSLRDAAIQVTEILQKGLEGSEVLKPLLLLGDADKYVMSAIDDTRPPTRNAMIASNGRSLLQWLLQRILPYPTFLIDEAQLAARCRLSVQAFQKASKTSPRLQYLFENGRYRGALSEFLGPRWWFHEVDQILWNMTGGKSFDSAALREALHTELVSEEDVVLCIDENYAWEKSLARLEDAVRVSPEDWPTFARPAWMRRELLRDNPELRELVSPLDFEAASGA